MSCSPLRPAIRKWIVLRYATTEALLSSSICRNIHSGTRCDKQEELFPQRLSLPENRGYVPMLSPKQVSAVLSAYQESMKGVGKGSVQSFDSNFLPSNNPIEDRRAVGWLTQTGGSLFGVYDGHGGSACAQAVSERLFEYIAVSLLPPVLLEQYSHSMRSDSPLQILTRYNFRTDYVNDDLMSIYKQSLQRFVVETLSFSGDDASFSGSIADQLAAAFRRLDDDISHEALSVSGGTDLDLVEIALSGACGCIAHVNGINVDVANTGDCRAVIGRLRQDGSWLAVPMSIDQNIDNEAELKRVFLAHPNESGTIVKNDRLLGQLIPLRAFGDVRFKWCVEDLKRLALLVNRSNASHFIPMNYLSPPYLTANPDIVHHRLSKADKFMIIASDGLWETMSNERAVDIIGDHMLGKEYRNRSVQKSYSSLRLGEIAHILRDRQRGLAHKATDENGATHLIRHALGYDHPKVSEMLTFPPAVARHFRDDITVTIIYFDSEFLDANCKD